MGMGRHDAAPVRKGVVRCEATLSEVLWGRE
jgi:hypothetical protein